MRIDLNDFNVLSNCFFKNASVRYLFFRCVTNGNVSGYFRHPLRHKGEARAGARQKVEFSRETYRSSKSSGSGSPEPSIVRVSVRLVSDST